MKIGLIGCGRVGTTLFYLLRKHNTIVGVHDIKKYNERRTAQFLGIKENPPCNVLCEKSTAIFIATPDDTISSVYKSVRSFLIGRKYIYHFSGTLSSTIFPKKRGIYRASVHPFTTFPKLTIPPRRKQYPLYIEGDVEARTSAGQIFRSQSFTISYVSREDKIYHHLIGVFASNFIVSLLCAISVIQQRAHSTKRDMRRAIFPIIQDTLLNIEHSGLYKSLSGPLERGDVSTIKRHLKALRQNRLLLESYRTLSLMILDTIPNIKNKRTLRKILNTTCVMRRA